MLRKTLTILSLSGLLLSVGLWGVSYSLVMVLDYPAAGFGVAVSDGHSEIRLYRTSAEFDAQEARAGGFNYVLFADLLR